VKLYTYYRSSAAYRVRIALNLKALDYTAVPVNLLEGEQRGEAFRAVNPQGLVPALEVEDGTRIGQSTAILEWLEESFPERPLLPADPLARARVRSLCNHIACDIHPLNNLRVMNYLKGEFGHSQEDVNRWYGHWIRTGFKAVENTVSGEGGPFCFGEAPGLADCYLIPQVYNARRFDVGLGEFPTIERIFAHCNGLEPFFDAHPDNQSDG
jgi:maleylacetoacetate isomerase